MAWVCPCSFHTRIACISMRWLQRCLTNVMGLTHWGRAMHICVNEIIIIGSDNGLSPGWRQAIIWTNVGILLIGPLGINFNEIWIEINTFSFKEMHLKMSSAKWRLFRLGLNVLKPKRRLEVTPNDWWGRSNYTYIRMHARTRKHLHSYLHANVYSYLLLSFGIALHLPHALVLKTICLYFYYKQIKPFCD